MEEGTTTGFAIDLVLTAINLSGGGDLVKYPSLTILLLLILYMHYLV